MVNATSSLTSLTDDQLLARVKVLAHHERQSTAALIAALTELDARRLYLGEGYPSLFAYCTRALHLSEDAAYNRIRAARVAAKWPVLLDLIADGSVTVTAVRLLSDVLTDTNHRDLLLAARHKSKRDVEVIVATLNPRPAVATSVRKLPTRAAATAWSGSTDAPLPLLEPNAPAANRSSVEDRPTPRGIATPAHVGPLSPDQFKLQFTIPKTTHDKLRRAQDLMRHTNATGDPAVIFDRALSVLLEQLERAKLGRVARPRREQRATRRGSRHVPAAVKREVWTRDGGRCAFAGTSERCPETGFLEYHHVVPFANGGEAIAANIQLRCRAHNAYEAGEWFGPLVVRERQSRYFSDHDRRNSATAASGQEATAPIQLFDP